MRTPQHTHGLLAPGYAVTSTCSVLHVEKLQIELVPSLRHAHAGEMPLSIVGARFKSRQIMFDIWHTSQLCTQSASCACRAFP